MAAKKRRTARRRIGSQDGTTSPGRVLDVEAALAAIRLADGRSLLEVLRRRSPAESLAELRDFMATQPFPHFEGVPGRPDLLAKIDADGRRTVGRFVGREWRSVAAK